MTAPRVETFRLGKDLRTVYRVVVRRRGKKIRTTFALPAPLNGTRLDDDRLAGIAEATFLRATRRPPSRRVGQTIRVADLFSGCGAMSLGIREACRALGLRFMPVLALDVSTDAVKVYKTNFPLADTNTTDIRQILRGRIGPPFTVLERRMKKLAGRIDIAVAGPPCQGHSDLNNRTRRHDQKNGLYFRVARFAEVVKPKHLIVENVPAVRRDHGRVVGRTRKALERLGYKVTEGIVELADIGVPQTRRRHVLIASLKRSIDLDDILAGHHRKTRPVGWAISDLMRRRSPSVMDRRPAQTGAAVRRIRYLFARGIYDLPNRLRPPCHRSNNHTYHSVYGRLRWNLPAQTITSGFTCMGQGRFVHPKAPRTLTPREAARLQFIPDFFVFGESLGMTMVAEMIGNAVPPKLTYVLALELLR